MLIKEFTQAELDLEKPFKENWKRVKDAGLCPTCEQAKSKNVFYEDDREYIYEDDLVLVKFEHSPRREGHSIVIIKPHYEDISEMPMELAHKFMAVSKALIDSLNEVLNPVKVYLVTMCDGGRNHLHFQYIPRYEGQSHGKHVFVDERKTFHYEEETVKEIKKKFLERLYFYNY